MMDGQLAALSLSLGRSRATPANARSEIRHALTGTPAESFVDDVLLAASELITNAITYTEGGCDIRASWSNDQPWVRVEVSDIDSSLPTVPEPPSQQSVGGHGLLIVSSLARRWGLQRKEHGKTIWFELGTLLFPRLFEVSPSPAATVGSLQVRRALPRPTRRTVGAWCFADHLGPKIVGNGREVDIGPHPHCGLQTVTWLASGELLHRDSLGSEQLIRAGELNLMTSGGGVSHSEEGPSTLTGAFHGVQMWVAQPEATRHGDAAFEHHPTLPQVELDNATATVLVGDFADVVAPARRDTEHVGVELLLRPGTAVAPLRLDYEHALVMLEGDADVDGRSFGAGHLGYLGMGRDELSLSSVAGARIMLLGGVPFPEEIRMSWNFVGRNEDELDAAHASWNSDDGRFGVVDSNVARIPAPERRRR